MKSAVIVFPGSNCDRDMAVAHGQVTGKAPAMVWHRESELPDGVDFIALPGGFSSGDSLRSGAMAARPPLMRAIADSAALATPALGVCQCFHLLTQAYIPQGPRMPTAQTNLVYHTIPLTITP